MCYHFRYVFETHCKRKFIVCVFRIGCILNERARIFYFESNLFRRSFTPRVRRRHGSTLIPARIALKVERRPKRLRAINAKTQPNPIAITRRRATCRGWRKNNNNDPVAAIVSAESRTRSADGCQGRGSVRLAFNRDPGDVRTAERNADAAAAAEEWRGQSIRLSAATRSSQPIGSRKGFIVRVQRSE